MENISEDADDLLVLMNKKEIATGKQKNFDGEIERLEAEMSYYSGRNSREPEVISSSKPGANPRGSSTVNRYSAAIPRGESLCGQIDDRS